MTISLKPINRENWVECIQLTVNENQLAFIATNLYSIAEVQFLPDFKAMGIYNEDKMIGFTLFGIDEDDQNYWIYRFMIDKNHQGKGYGKQGLHEVLKYLNQKHDCSLVMVGYHRENKTVDNLYKSVGFEPDGVAPWGELLAKYSFS